MYIVNSLNQLYKEIKNFMEGSSYIQEGVFFKIIVDKEEKIFKIEEKLNKLVLSNEKEEIESILFTDIENDEDKAIETIYKKLLEEMSIIEEIKGDLLENIYAAKLKVILQKTKLYHVNLLSEVSCRTKKSFMLLKNISELNIKSIERKDSLLILKNLNKENKEEILEYKIINY